MDEAAEAERPQRIQAACDALRITNALAARRNKLVEEHRAATEAGDEDLAATFEMLLAVPDDRERLHRENDALAHRALAAETRVHELTTARDLSGPR